MKINHLFAYGCSNTYGEALADCWDIRDGVGTGAAKPSRRAWPVLAARQLGISATNLSIPGVSNTMIAHRVLNSRLKPSTAVVIGWTHWNRETIIHSPDSGWHSTPGLCKEFLSEEFTGLGPWITDNSHFTPRQQKINRTYYSVLHDDVDSELRGLRMIELIDLYCKSQGVSVTHLLYDTTEIHRPRWSRASIIGPTLREIMMKHPLAQDNIHPGEAAHEEIAGLIAARLRSTV